MNWQTYLEERQVDFTERLLEFLRIPSISSLPEHSADVRAAGEWVAAQLRSAGMEHVEIMETGGHPVVYADWLHAPGKPTVLIYGHFDVQPVDPLSLWNSPPFEPVIQAGRVYARGASDDKGNMLAPLLALEALLATEGALPINVKCFWEGQEEIGSPTLPAFVAAHRDRFACDFVLSADGGQWGEDQPELLVGLRGLCALQVDVVGPAYDVHSGLYGGAIQNPIHALAALLASLRDAEGRVQVEGFYDDVLELSAAERAEIARIPYDEAGVRQNLGIDTFFGEAGYSALERSWVRPTLEVNGIWCGFQ
jgi:acetylornithine deacetylase/succinyl-diaminopimelate desuccinylase-like protein